MCMCVCVCGLTVEDLLHGLVAHLRGGEALQGHDGRVGPGVEQQAAGLDVARQRRPVEGRLAQRVHRVHLETPHQTNRHTHRPWEM